MRVLKLQKWGGVVDFPNLFAVEYIKKGLFET
jgi:hypothetical protein